MLNSDTQTRGIMGNIMDAIGSILRDWFSLLLLGLGISLAPYEYIGGLLLAFAGAAIARAWERDSLLKEELPNQRNKYWLIVATAFFVAHVTSLVTTKYFPHIPVQLVMAASGFASRWIVVFMLNAVQGFSRRGDTVAGRVMDKFLPPDQKG